MEVDEFRPPENAEPVETDSNKAGLLRFATDILEIFILSAFLFFVINALSARIRVDGTSMEPNLHTGELVIVDKVSYVFGEPQRGDIIVFHYPRNPEKEYIKRVIGLPGDQVDVSEGQVYINGQALQEPYIAAAPIYPGKWVVSAGTLFVLGDNRNNSDDSHRWGTVPLDYVIGKATLVYWPPEDWGLIEHYAYAAP